MPNRLAPPPTPTKWNERLTVAPQRTPVHSVHHAAAVVSAAGQTATQPGTPATPAASAVPLPLVPVPVPVPLPCAPVRALLGRAMCATSAFPVPTIHDIGHYTTRPSANVAHGHALLALATAQYVRDRLETSATTQGVTTKERVRMHTVLQSPVAVSRYATHLALHTVYPCRPGESPVVPFETLLGALHADQRAAASALQATFPAHTQRGSALDRVFASYSPDAQAYACVAALVAGTYDACWTAFFGVSSVTDVELRSLVTSDGGDPATELTARFVARYGCPPEWRFGTKDGVHTCSVHHLDGATMGEGTGTTRFAAEEAAAVAAAAVAAS